MLVSTIRGVVYLGSGLFVVEFFADLYVVAFGFTEMCETLSDVGRARAPTVDTVRDWQLADRESHESTVRERALAGLQAVADTAAARSSPEPTTLSQRGRGPLASRGSGDGM